MIYTNLLKYALVLLRIYAKSNGSLLLVHAWGDVGMLFDFTSKQNKAWFNDSGRGIFKLRFINRALRNECPFPCILSPKWCLLVVQAVGTAFVRLYILSVSVSGRRTHETNNDQEEKKEELCEQRVQQQHGQQRQQQEAQPCRQLQPLQPGTCKHLLSAALAPPSTRTHAHGLKHTRTQT